MPFNFKPIERWFESDSGLILPVPVSQGGTGATTAAGALANLGAPSLSAAQTWSGVNFFSGSSLRTSDLAFTDPADAALKYEWYFNPGDGTFRLFDDVNNRDLLVITPGSQSILSNPGLAVTGLTGATAGARLVGGTASGAPTSGSFNAGDFIIDQTGQVFIYTGSGWVGGTGFNWRNATGGFVIQASTTYGVNDALLDAGGSWRCILGYTSAASPVAPSVDTTHWTWIAQQGATGPTGGTGSTGPAGAGGELAHAEIAQTGTALAFTNTTVADWAGMSISPVFPSSGAMFIDVQVGPVQITGAGVGFTIHLTDSSNNLQTYAATADAYATGHTVGGIRLGYRATGSAGVATTFKVRELVSSAGTATIEQFAAVGKAIASIRATAI